MLEQQLINAFMKLTAKAGAGELVKNLIQAVDEDGNPKHWNAREMQEAIIFINKQIDTFDKQQALGVVRTLMNKFSIQPSELYQEDTVIVNTSVKGLQ